MPVCVAGGKGQSKGKGLNEQKVGRQLGVVGWQIDEEEVMEEVG
jgi:hypothetical protein